MDRSANGQVSKWTGQKMDRKWTGQRMDRSENGQVRKWIGHRSDMTRIRQLGHKRSSDQDALEISG